MGFRVRNDDGEMRFESFREVHNAYLIGLIEPKDEILEDGTEKWRQAETYPMLRDVPKKARPKLPPQVVVLLILGILALVALFTMPGWVALVLSAFAAFTAMGLTAREATRPRKR